jgi:hypothetical protein
MPIAMDASDMPLMAGRADGGSAKTEGEVDGVSKVWRPAAKAETPKSEMEMVDRSGMMRESIFRDAFSLVIKNGGADCDWNHVVQNEMTFSNAT